VKRTLVTAFDLEMERATLVFDTVAERNNEIAHSAATEATIQARASGSPSAIAARRLHSRVSAAAHPRYEVRVKWSRSSASDDWAGEMVISDGSIMGIIGSMKRPRGGLI
jgi:hypothetical protein